MGLLLRAAHVMFGDRVPSNEERTLRLQAKQLRRRARWANRLSKNTAATRMVNQQALQMAMAYEIIREQRYRRLVVLYTEKRRECKIAKFLHRAQSSHLIIVQLQQQLQAYDPLPPPYIPVAQLAYPTHASVQARQQQDALAAVPVAMHAPPPAYSTVYPHYPTISQSNTTTASPSSSRSYFSQSDVSSMDSPMSDRSQLQEPWLKAGERQTVY